MYPERNREMKFCKVCLENEARGSATELCDSCWEVTQRLGYMNKATIARAILAAEGLK